MFKFLLFIKQTNSLNLLRQLYNKKKLNLEKQPRVSTLIRGKHTYRVFRNFQKLTKLNRTFVQRISSIDELLEIIKRTDNLFKIFSLRKKTFRAGRQLTYKTLTVSLQKKKKPMKVMYLRNFKQYNSATFIKLTLAIVKKPETRNLVDFYLTQMDLKLC